MAAESTTVTFSVTFPNSELAAKAVNAFARAQGWVAPAPGAEVPAPGQKFLTAEEAANQTLWDFVSNTAKQRLGQDAIESAQTAMMGVTSTVKVS